MVVKREDGFGFTLTQEMPVFVDKVFNGSSAQKAGSHPKDRIIKVCGCGVGVTTSRSSRCSIVCVNRLLVGVVRVWPALS